MKQKKVPYIFLYIIFIIGVLLSFDAIRQQLTYHSIRLLRGNILEFNCYAVQLPTQWLIHKQENRNSKVTYTIRKYDDTSKKYNFVSVVQDIDNIILSDPSMKEKVTNGNEDIHELTSLDSNNPVRFFSKINDTPFILIGESTEVMSEFMSNGKQLSEFVKSTCK